MHSFHFHHEPSGLSHDSTADVWPAGPFNPICDLIPAEIFEFSSAAKELCLGKLNQENNHSVTDKSFGSVFDIGRT